MAERGQRVGRWIRAKTESWAGGANISFTLDILRTIAGMSAPVVKKCKFRWNLAITMAGATTFLGEDHPKLWTNIVMRDAVGQRIELAGAGLRFVNQLIEGQGQVDAATAPAGASTLRGYLDLPFHCPRAKRPADFGVPVAEFLTGEFSVSTAAATGVITDLTVNSGTLEAWFYIEDEGTPELKSRFVIREHRMQLQEDSYPCTGDLTLFAAYAQLAAPNPGYYSAWLTAVGEIVSRNLDINNVRYDVMVNDYQKHAAAPGLGANDGVIAGKLFLVRGMLMDDKFTERRAFTQSVHLDIKVAPPALAVVIVGQVTDRDPDVAARTLKFSTTDAMFAAAKDGAVVKTASGSGDRSVKSWPAVVSGRAPVKIAQRTPASGGAKGI